MQTRNVFRDGQTIGAYIAPVEGLHAGLSFERRPMLAAEVEETEAQIGKATPRQAAEITILAVTNKLVSWSEVDDKGGPLPITAANVGRLPYQLLVRTYRIIAGLAPSDLSRAQAEVTGPDEAAAYIARLKEAAETGAPVGAIANAATEKNS